MAVNRAAKPEAKVSLPQRRLHDLRDTNATLLSERGWPLELISKLPGHTGIGMTADRYVHPRRVVVQTAAADLDALFGAPTQEQPMNNKALEEGAQQVWDERFGAEGGI